MQIILIFIAGAVFGAFLYAAVGAKGFHSPDGTMEPTERKKKTQVVTFADTPKDELKEIQKEAQEALSERTDQRKRKILEAMKEAKKDFLAGCNLRDGKNEKGISCEEVGKLLDISSATARRYLNNLEDEKKIKQVGKAGKGVYYVLAK